MDPHGASERNTVSTEEFRLKKCLSSCGLSSFSPTCVTRCRPRQILVKTCSRKTMTHTHTDSCTLRFSSNPVRRDWRCRKWNRHKTAVWSLTRHGCSEVSVQNLEMIEIQQSLLEIKTALFSHSFSGGVIFLKTHIHGVCSPVYVLSPISAHNLEIRAASGLRNELQSFHGRKVSMILFWNSTGI